MPSVAEQPLSHFREWSHLFNTMAVEFEVMCEFIERSPQYSWHQDIILSQHLWATTDSLLDITAELNSAEDLRADGLQFKMIQVLAELSWKVGTKNCTG